MAKDEDFYEDDENYSGFLRKFFFILILLICLVVVYAKYIGTSGLILKEYTIDKYNTPLSYKGFKIAHFSDVHYGNNVGIKELKNIVKKINMTKPDIIVFSGDLIDKRKKITEEEVNEITEILKGLDSTYGKYYVSGDEDLNCESYGAIFDGAGFMSLDNSFDVIYNKSNESILISGLSANGDSAYLNELFKNLNIGYKIFVMHMPDDYSKIDDYKFDLILSGHSLNGQIVIPFYGGLFKYKGSKEYYNEHYKLDDSDLYISGGIGTKDYDYRLFNRPSFNLYKLKNSSI